MWCAHLLVGEEVDDGVVDGTGLGEVHRHGGEQRRDVELRVQDHHHRQGSVGQPADEERDDHGQHHVDGVMVLLLAGAATLQLHAAVQLTDRWTETGLMLRVQSVVLNLSFSANHKKCGESVWVF